jgi:hypothetical protein
VTSTLQPGLRCPNGAQTLSEQPEDLLVQGELVSLELDGNGLAIEVKLDDGSAFRLERPVTSPDAIELFRHASRIMQETFRDMGQKYLVLAPIEPNNPDEEYVEPDA